MATTELRLSSKVDKQSRMAEILIRFYHGKAIDQRAKTGIHILPSYWKDNDMPDIQKRIQTDDVVYHTQAKVKLDNLKGTISKAFLAVDKSDIKKGWLESIIDQFNFPEKYAPKDTEPEKPLTLLQYIDEFIAKSPERKHRETGRLLSSNNIQQYMATRKHIKDFAKSMRKKDFEFAQINQKFYDAFVAYLQILNFAQNTVGKHIRVLKLMLNEAPKELKEVASYEKFHVFNEEVDTIYLNEVELQQLKDANFGDAHHLDRVRDWFLLLAWTGSRFSDLKKIGKSDIKRGFITFRQQKTNTRVTIPLHPVVQEVLAKYDYQMPEPISNQRFNEYIKDACKRTEINSLENVTTTIGGKLQTTTHPKYELVSSHTGRRSFATNMYKQGLPSLMIMSITGHKTEKSFLKYIRVTQAEHAKMMAEAWNKMYNQDKKGEQ